MTIKLVEIIFATNGERVMDKLTGKTTKNTAATEVNALAHEAVDAQTKKAGLSSLIRSRRMDALTTSLKKNTAATWIQTRATRALNAEQRTAGINVGMLSLRIGEWLVPMLALAYTAMLPVIAGLLAIASAAAVAMGGLVGLVGIGLWKWSDQYNQSMDVPFNRRPDMQGGQQDFMKEILKPIKDALDDPSIIRKVNLAVSWTKDIFAITLPNAIKGFINNVDMRVMADIIGRFATWLPNATSSLAQFGNQLYAVIGPESLAAINKLFKYLAGGLMNTAKWLKSGGLDQLDSFFGIIGDFLSLALDLGKSVLPVLVRMLQSVYPSPIKPVVNLLVALFKELNNSKSGMAIVTSLAQLFTAFVLLSGVTKLLTVAVRLVRVLPMVLIAGLILAIPRLLLMFVTRVGLALGIVAADIWKVFQKLIMLIYEGIGKLFGWDIQYDKDALKLQNPLDFFLGDGDNHGYVDTSGLSNPEFFNWLANAPEFEYLGRQANGAYGDAKNTYLDVKLILDGNEVAYAVEDSLVRNVSGNTSTKKNIGVFGG